HPRHTMPSPTRLRVTAPHNAEPDRAAPRGLCHWHPCVTAPNEASLCIALLCIAGPKHAKPRRTKPHQTSQPPSHRGVPNLAWPRHSILDHAGPPPTPPSPSPSIGGFGSDLIGTNSTAKAFLCRFTDSVIARETRI